MIWFSDWYTHFERGIIDNFRSAIPEMENIDIPVDDSGRSMLMYAVSGFSELVTLLIKSGADVNYRELYGRPVWDFIPSGERSIKIWAEMIEAGLDVNSRAPRNETPLISVCLAKTTDHTFINSSALLLINAGADVNAQNEFKDTALTYAASAGNALTIKSLLKAGANPDNHTKSGRTGLHEAAIWGHADVIRLLIQKGAQVDDPSMIGGRFISYPVYTSREVSYTGMTPLLAAAEFGHYEALHLLADAGGNINHADSTGFTPLMGAAKCGKDKIVKFLLERGAVKNAKDVNGKNAQMYAAEVPHHEVLHVLQKA